MVDATDQDRADIARRAASRRTWRVAFSPERPSRWNPSSVINPGDGQPFTVAGCWDFIVEAVLSGQPIEVIRLRKPPGKRAFVLLLDGHAGARVYVKLEMLSDVVLGRSFHISDPGRDEDE